MRSLLFCLLYAGVIGPAGVVVPAAAQGQEAIDNTLMIDARNGPPIVPITIGDDTYEFLVDPSFSDNGIINAQLAKQHKITNVNFLGLKADLEGKKLKTKAGGIDIKIGDILKDKNKLFFWFEQDAFPPYDGIIGGGSFKKFDKVIFLLGDSATPQKIFSATLRSKKDWFITTPLGADKRLQAWSRFSLHYDYTHSNLLLTQSLKDRGKITQGQIVYNMTKVFSTPAKLLDGRLIDPVSLLRGDFTHLKLQVPESSLVASEKDDITVKATHKKRSAKEPPQIYLGRDYFEGCTSLEFIPAEKQVNLYCDDAG